MILLPKAPKIINTKENWAQFEIEGLYPGYGVTVGNSLRRVLLSSLEGSAITQVKIKGVQHEFSTISGILEDVITIIMNLKQLRFKSFSDEPEKAILKIKGEKKVTGADFKVPSQLELVNKDAHIATLTDSKTELEMEVQIEKGIGYEPVERRKQDKKLEIGTIAIDAIYTPVKRVSYKVENMRVGDRTDFDKLTLEIETDGIVTPEEAFFQASDVLLKHFALLNDEFKPVEVKKEAKKPVKKETKKVEKKPVKKNEKA
ncbi:DNA-directed RNA polymerase subunit alpha [Patescibacteria group bacterium]|nr:DNA-directed RNA polymerase subunit alpha [Patescibacteria group bacterium]